MNEYKGYTCHKCGASPEDGSVVWLERMNFIGHPGIWECRPECGANLHPDDAVIMAIEHEDNNDHE